MSIKGCIPRICNEPSRFNNRKTKHSIKIKISKIFEQTIIKEDIEMANKHNKTCSLPLGIRKMQFKTQIKKPLRKRVRMASKIKQN